MGVQVIKGIRENSGSRITIASAGTDDRDPAYRLVRYDFQDFVSLRHLSVFLMVPYQK